MTPEEPNLEIEFTQCMLAYITEHFKKHAEDKGILKIGEICRELGIRLSPAQMKMEREAFLKARTDKARSDANHQR